MERVSRKSIEQASLWMARMWSENVSEQDRRAFQLWRTRHPDNDYAWRQMEQLQKKFSAIPDAKIGSRVLNHRKSGVSRRQVLIWGGISIATMSLVLSSDAALPQGETEYASMTGEVKDVQLSDGTLIVMNTASRIRVDFNQQKRLVRLIEGEIMVTTGHHLTPFHVLTPQGSVTPIGTRFSVRIEGGRTQVSVFEGEVVTQPHQTDASLSLVAGEKSHFSLFELSSKEALMAGDGLWLEKKILAKDMPLPEFLNELSRYRQGVVKVAPELAHFRVSGVFSMTDTDQTLDNLSQILPIKVKRRTQFWVSISRKKV